MTSPAPDRPVSSPKSPDHAETAAQFQTPGIYMGETGTKTQTIQGVGTSTAAFAGPTLSGPVGRVPEVLTSFAQFETAYGDLSDISFSSPPLLKTRNYVALAARAFFENGGERLYVARVASPGGSNTAAPTADDYSQALSTLDGIEEVSVVAAPGGMIADESGLGAVAPIHSALIEHVSQPGAYRFAVLDPPPECSTDEMETLRACLDSINAAIYYPWVTIANPLDDPAAAKQIIVPPSGFICGVYARTDLQQGVFKPPANQPLIGAISFERTIALLESDTLNALGINCLRSFPGRGNLVWGARTISSDTEWKYVNIRRYLLYLEHSIDRGTQWVVFEPNGEQLWASVRQSVNDFLYNEWRSGALAEAKPEQAFFVRCDRTTMTENDLDNGRLICTIGVALIRPEEFVIFRITQQTADGTTP